MALASLDEGADIASVAALFDRCSDYFMLQDGEPATLDDARDLFRDVPPDRHPNELVLFGSRGPNGLQAVAALLPDYPTKGVWYLPFMAVDPSCRGRGLGRAFHTALKQ